MCRKSFLSLWSYPRVTRDQGRKHGKGDGKEVGDLLVVFENDVIIFSIKECAFKDTGNLHQDWCRWYRGAIEESAPQVWAAERWVKEHPDKLFLDRACTDPFPLEIPNGHAAKFHRVLVALGAAERCRRELGGSGALRIAPDIVGAQHYFHPDQGGMPFTVGRIDRFRGYVHVLDDVSLATITEELDTISEFIGYLSEKEQLIAGGLLESAPTESDLLAEFLFPREHRSKSGFDAPSDGTRLAVPEGTWEQFDRDPYRIRQREEDSVSYLWDQLIESNAEPVINGTAYFSTHPGIQSGEKVLRLLAREPRWKRRDLAKNLQDLILSTENIPRDRFTRVLVPADPDQTCYAFLLLARDRPWPSEEAYRTNRRELLYRLCEVVKLHHPHVLDIVGIATATGRDAFTSQDIVWRDARVFTEEHRAQAEAIVKDTGLLTNVAFSEHTHYEYPNPDSPPVRLPIKLPERQMKGRDRNLPCPCRSGRKYKHCCGRPLML